MRAKRDRTPRWRRDSTRWQASAAEACIDDRRPAPAAISGVSGASDPVPGVTQVCLKHSGPPKIGGGGFVQHLQIDVTCGGPTERPTDSLFRRSDKERVPVGFSENLDDIYFGSSRMVELLLGSYEPTVDFTMAGDWTPADGRPLHAEWVDHLSLVGWRSVSDEAARRKSMHFRGLVPKASAQLPGDRPGAIYVGYEGVGGNGEDGRRHHLNRCEMASFEPGKTGLRMVYGNLLHARACHVAEREFGSQRDVGGALSRIPLAGRAPLSGINCTNYQLAEQKHYSWVVLVSAAGFCRMHANVTLNPPPLRVPGLMLAILREARLGRQGRATRRFASPPDEDECRLDRARRRRARIMVERLLSARSQGPVELGRLVARHATLEQIATPSITHFHTSAERILVPDWSARLLLVAISELVHSASTAARTPSGAALYLAVGWDGGQLVVALAVRHSGCAPVLTGSGADALMRADRVARAMGGGLVRGMESDGMLFGLTFEWPYAGVDHSILF